MNEAFPMVHQVVLSDRKTLAVTGVSEVDAFDDTLVTVRTSAGDLTVRGQALNVRQLNIESGDLAVDGQIDMLEYTVSPTKKGGRLAKWFR